MNRNCKYANYGTQRIGIFVDVHNAYVTSKELYNSKVNYEKIIPELANERDIVIAKAYLMVKDEQETLPFIDALKHCGFDTELKVSETREYQDKGSKEKITRRITSWDVGIALDIIKWEEKLDVVVLMSGNGCHVDTLKYLKTKGIRIEVAFFEKYTSKALIELADDFVDLGINKNDGNTVPPPWLDIIAEKVVNGNK